MCGPQTTSKMPGFESGSSEQVGIPYKYFSFSCKSKGANANPSNIIILKLNVSIQS